MNRPIETTTNRIRTSQSAPLLLALLATFMTTSLGRAAVQAIWQLDTSEAPSLVHHDMTYDSTRHALIVAGRQTFEEGSPVEVYLGHADGRWTALPSPAPGGHDVEIAYDADRDVTVLYTDDTNHVWELSGNTWRVIEAATAPVQCFDGAMLQYDPVRKKTVLVACDGWPGPTSETWLWDGTNWALAAGTAQSPPNAAGGGMVFDAARGEMVLLTMDTMQTWTFDGAGWTQRMPATTPAPGVWVFDMAYHPPTQRVVMYGGEHAMTTPPYDSTYPTHTWAWNGTDWELLQPPTAPPDTIDYGFAWFPERDALVMHGGWGPTGDWAHRNTVWLLTLSSETLPSVRLVDIRRAPSGEVTLTSQGRVHPGKAQVLQGCEALGTAALWLNLQTNSLPAETNLWQFPGAGPRHYYRIWEFP